MLLLSERIGAHIQHCTALRDFPKQTLHFIVLQHLCIAGAERGLKSLTHLPPLCVIRGIPHQRWKVLSAQLWFLFHSLPDMLTMAKALEARSIWQKSCNCHHIQKELLYPKNSTDVLAEVPGKSVLANPLQCRKDLLFVFPSFHYRAPVSSFEAPRRAHTQPHSYKGSPRPSAHHPAVCPSSVGQHVPRRICFTPLCYQNPDQAWQLRGGMPQRPRCDFPAQANPWEALPASQSLLATGCSRPDVIVYLLG